MSMAAQDPLIHDPAEGVRNPLPRGARGKPDSNHRIVYQARHGGDNVIGRTAVLLLSFGQVQILTLLPR
jgi:hypothetical protein